MRKFWIGCVCNLIFACAAFAGDGHDHGEEKAAVAPLSPAAPRLVMESSQFELVGTLEGDGLHLFLDDHDSNAPVTAASVELEISGQRVKAEAESDGSYHAALPQPLPEGEYTVQASIITSEKIRETLMGDLDVHATDANQSAAAHPSNDWEFFVPWLMGLGFIALAIVVFTLRYDRQQRKGQA